MKIKSSIFLCIIFLMAWQCRALMEYQLTPQPVEIEGIVLWLDADDLDGDGVAEGMSESSLQDGKVLSWADKSGKDNHAVQTVETAMPGYALDNVNSHSVVTFNNQGQFLNIDLDEDEYNQHTIFIVTQTGPLPIANNFGTLLAFNDGNVGVSNPNKRQPAIFLRDNNCLGLSYNDAVGVHHSYNFPAFSGFGLVSIKRGALDVDAYLNGQLLYSDSFEQQPQNGNDSVGKNVLNSSTYKGQIAEIIVYDRALKDHEFEQVSYYLQCKYALATGYEEQFLVLTAKQKQWLAQSRKAGLIELDEVLVPNSSNVIADNDHFGWPVAAMSGDNVVVHCQQNLSHYSPEYPWNATSNNQSIGIIIRSADRGKTWQEPVYVRDVVSYRQGPNAGGMISIGVNALDEIVLKHSYYPYGGCLISDDGGVSWVHRNQAFSNLTTLRENVGPRIVSHPEFGLLMFTGSGQNSGLSILNSTDNGLTWTDRYWTDGFSAPKEPCAMIWDDNILLISREFSDLCSEDGRFQMMSQHLYKYSDGDTLGDIEFETKRTNIRGNIAPLPGRQVWAHDTADVNMNPVTSRIEMLDSHRWGMGLGDTGDNLETHKSSLNIWSIAPESLLEGESKWRFDGTLLSRDRSSHHGIGFADGLHPGAAVIDEVNNKQHIFLYAGFSDRRAAVYKLSRSLDTERLRKWLLNTYSTEWDFDEAEIIHDESGYELNSQVEGVVSYITGSERYGSSASILLDSSDNCVRFSGADNDYFDFEQDDAFTLEVICRSLDDGPIISKDSVSDGGWQLSVRNGKVCFGVSDGSNQSTAISDVNINDNAWHHIAAVRDNGKLLVYVDHILYGCEDDNTELLDNEEDLLIGASNVTREKFIGAIDWIKISRVPLTSSQFRMPIDYTTDDTPNAVIDLVGSYNIDQDGKVICWPDRSAHGAANNACASDVNHAPQVNDIVFANGVTLKALVFNGSDYLEIDGSEIFDRRQISFFVYFKPDDIISRQCLLSADYDDRGDGIASFMLWGSFIENGNLYSQSGTKEGVVKRISSPIASQWMLLSVVWDGSELRQYINGELAGVVDGIDCEPFYNQGVIIGSRFDGTNGFNGKIAGLIVYDKALDQQQRTAVERQICRPGAMPYAAMDANKDSRTDYYDLSVMSDSWLSQNCLPPDWCDGIDIDYNGDISYTELKKIISEWLTQ